MSRARLTEATFARTRRCAPPHARASLPFLKEQVGNLFLRWSAANAVAIEAKAKQMELVIPGYGTWKNKVGGPQKYQRKSLNVLRGSFRDATSAGAPGTDEGEGPAALRELMWRAGCLEALAGARGAKM